MKLRPALQVLVPIFLICALSFGACDVISTHQHEKRKITFNEPPANFAYSVVVVTSADAEVVFGDSQLHELTSNHPDYSFLIPQDQIERVRRQITIPYEEVENCDTRPYLEVQQLASDRQLIHLVMAGDPYTQEYWYEATDKQTVLRAYRVEGAVEELAEFLWVLPASLFIGCFIFFFGWGFVRSLTKFVREMRSSA